MKPIDWDAVHASGKEYRLVPEAVLDAVFSYAGTPTTALDIACGTGALVAQLARRGLKVTGTDISKTALAAARERLAAAGLTANFVHADFGLSQFFSAVGGPFDLVFIRLGIAFVQDKDTFLNMVASILAPQGVFICSTPVLLPGGTYDGHQQRISVPKDELESLLKRYFASVEVAVQDESDRPDWPVSTYLCRNG